VGAQFPDTVDKLTLDGDEKGNYAGQTVCGLHTLQPECQGVHASVF
jgi:hypothetical protein